MRKRSTSLAASLVFSALLHGVASADTASCPPSTSVSPVSFLALERYEVRVTDGGLGDLDGSADGACSLDVTACLGTAACTPAPVERVRVAVRGRTIGTTPRDVARDITDAFAALPWAARDGFQLGSARRVVVPILVDGQGAEAAVSYDKDGMSVLVGGATPAADARVFLAGDEAYILRHGRQTRVRFKDVSEASTQAGAGDGSVKAPMHGKVLELFVRGGEAVASGQRVAVLEAMKMEHTLRAPFAGTVTNVAVVVGTQVVEGAQIMMIERAAAE